MELTNLDIKDFLDIPADLEEFYGRLDEFEKNSFEGETEFLKKTIKGYTNARMLYYEVYRLLRFSSSDYWEIDQLISTRLPKRFVNLQRNHESPSEDIRNPKYGTDLHNFLFKLLTWAMLRISESCYFLERFEEAKRFCKKILRICDVMGIEHNISDKAKACGILCRIMLFLDEDDGDYGYLYEGLHYNKRERERAGEEYADDKLIIFQNNTRLDRKLSLDRFNFVHTETEYSTPILDLKIGFRFTNEHIRVNTLVFNEIMSRGSSNDCKDSFDESRKNDHEYILSKVKQDAHYLKLANPELRNDRRIVRYAIFENPCLGLKHASEELKNDKSMVLLAVLRDWKAIKFAGKKIRSDPWVMSKVIKINALSFNYIGTPLRNDAEPVLKLMENLASLSFDEYFEYYTALVSEELKSNSSFLRRAVLLRPRLLRFCPSEFCEDRKLMIEAVKRNARCVVFAKKSLIEDRNFVLLVSKMLPGRWVLDKFSDYRGYEVDYIPPKTNRTFFLDCLRTHKEDREVVLSLSKYLFDTTKEEFPQWCFDDFEFISEAIISAPTWTVSTNTLALAHASDRLKNDKKFVLRILDVRCQIRKRKYLRYVSERLRGDKDVVLKAISSFHKEWVYVKEELKNDELFVRDQALPKNPDILKYCSEDIRNDKELIYKLLELEGKRPKSFTKNASLALRKDRSFALKVSNVYEENDFFRFFRDFAGDKEIVLSFLESSDGDILQETSFISKQLLRDDVEVLFAASKNSEQGLLQFANERIRNNRDVILQALSKNWDFSSIHLSGPSGSGHDDNSTVEYSDYSDVSVGNTDTDTEDSLSCFSSCSDTIVSVDVDADDVADAADENGNEDCLGCGCLGRKRTFRTEILENLRFRNNIIHWEEDAEDDDELSSGSYLGDSDTCSTITIASGSSSSSRADVDDEVVDFDDDENEEEADAGEEEDYVFYDDDDGCGDDEPGGVISNFSCLDPKFKNDVEIVQSAITGDPRVIEHLEPDFLRNNKDLLKSSITIAFKKRDHNSFKDKEDVDHYFQHLPPEYFEDRQFAIEAAKHELRRTMLFFDEFREDRALAKIAMYRNGCCLKHASDEFQNDKDMVLKAIWQNGKAFKYASEELKMDREVILHACASKDDDFFEYFIQGQEHLQGDREFVKKMILKSKGMVTEHLEEKYTDDKEIVMYSIKCFDNHALENCSNRLTHDRDVVFGALVNNPEEIEYTPQTFRSNRKFLLDVLEERARRKKDVREYISGFSLLEKLEVEERERMYSGNKEFVLASIRSGCYDDIRLCSDGLKKDREIIMESVMADGNSLCLVDSAFEMDEEIVVAALKQNGNALQFSKIEKFKNDKRFVFEMVKNNGRTLKFVNEEFLSDKELIIFAMNYSASALKYATEELKKDKELILAGVSIRYKKDEKYSNEETEGEQEEEVEEREDEEVFLDGALKYVHEELLESEEESIALSCIKLYPKDLGYVSRELLDRRDFVVKALSINGNCLKRMDYNVMNDIECVKVAMKQNKKALRYASERVRNIILMKL